MKYVFEAIMKTKAKYYITLKMIFSIISIWLNAKILLWFSAAVGNNDYFIYVVLGCVINTIIISCLEKTGIYKHILFTYLNIKYSEKIINADTEMFSKYSPGLIQSVGGNIYKYCSAVNIGINMVYNMITVIINMIAVIKISRIMAMPISIAAIFICISIFFIIKKWNKYDSEAEVLKQVRNIELDEITNGFIEARSFSETSESHKEAINRYNDQIINIYFKRSNLSILLSGTMLSADSICSILALLYVIMSQKGINPIIPTTGLTLIMYVWRLADPFSNFIFGFSEFSELMAGLPKFKEIMDYESKIHDGNITLDTFENDIEFNNVSFGYSTSGSVLNNISINIKKGSKIGICGPSGGGKSTFLKLLMRFYDVNSGSIKIDGIDIRNLKINSLRKFIGIVHQQTYIFDGTLRENIAYGMRPHKVDEYKIIEACKNASIYDFIMSLPEGLDTKVGPRGLKLSGGQKQRINLARIFLCDPEIILLDEATSALDNETETAVQEALKLFKNKTIITVAHRLSTIRDCDVIYVINNHKVAESGSHDQLMVINGIYAAMNK